MISHFFYLALECGYPEELHYKLLERKGKILMFFKQFVDARNVFKELLKALDKAKAIGVEICDYEVTLPLLSSREHLSASLLCRSKFQSEIHCPYYQLWSSPID